MVRAREILLSWKRRWLDLDWITRHDPDTCWQIREAPWKGQPVPVVLKWLARQRTGGNQLRSWSSFHRSSNHSHQLKPFQLLQELFRRGPPGQCQAGSGEISSRRVQCLRHLRFKEVCRQPFFFHRGCRIPHRCNGPAEGPPVKPRGPFRCGPFVSESD